MMQQTAKPRIIILPLLTRSNKLLKKRISRGAKEKIKRKEKSEREREILTYALYSYIDNAQRDSLPV